MIHNNFKNSHRVRARQRGWNSENSDAMDRRRPSSTFRARTRFLGAAPAKGSYASRGVEWSFLWERGSRGRRRGAVSWIHRHLDTSLASFSPVSERRSEFRYTVALPRGAQLVNTTSVETSASQPKERKKEREETICEGGREREKRAREGTKRGETGARRARMHGEWKREEKRRERNRGSWKGCWRGEGERMGVRENGEKLQPRRLSRGPCGDLPSRAKPLINAFAKKLHAVGGKQEQEGVGRARSNTRDLGRFLSLARSLPFPPPPVLPSLIHPLYSPLHTIHSPFLSPSLSLSLSLSLFNFFSLVCSTFSFSLTCFSVPSSLLCQKPVRFLGRKKKKKEIYRNRARLDNKKSSSNQQSLFLVTLADVVERRDYIHAASREMFLRAINPLHYGPSKVF